MIDEFVFEIGAELTLAKVVNGEVIKGEVGEIVFELAGWFAELRVTGADEFGIVGFGLTVLGVETNFGSVVVFVLADPNPGSDGGVGSGCWAIWAAICVGVKANADILGLNNGVIVRINAKNNLIELELLDILVVYL